MKKNILRGGIMSLIPKRDIEDADDVLDSIDEEEKAEEEVEEVVEEVEEKVEVVPEEAMPEKPLVTPLTIEIDEDDIEEELKGEKKVEKKKNPTSPRLPASAKATADRRGAGTEKISVVAVEELEEDELDKEVAEVKEVKKIKKVKKAEKAEEPEVEQDVAMWDKHEGEVHHIPISDIQINRSQPRRRFEEVEMQELTDSVAQHGILQPLVVRRGKSGGYDLVAGERRLRAAKSLDWDRVPCVVRRGVHSEAARIELALIENIQREDLNPVEEALAYQQLNEEYGMTHEEIGQRVGRSRVGITNTIRVLQLPEEVRKGVVDGIISAGHARAILMIPDEEKQKRFYRHLVAEGLTVRKAETRARRIQRSMNLDDPLRRKRRGRTAFEVKYSGELEDMYGFDTRLKFNEDKNRFEVMFKCHSQKDIDELLGRLLRTKPLPEKQDKDVIEDEE